MVEVIARDGGPHEISRRDARLWLELFLLFVATPGLLSLGPRWMVLVAILGGGLLCLGWLLLDPTFPRGALVDVTPLRRGLRALAPRALLACAGIFAVALLAGGPNGLFFFPRTHPRVWLVIVSLYPLLSAYPQEVMYRTFFFHRYAGLFRTPTQLLVTNALLFGWAHILVHNAVAMALTTVGGVLFALTYQRSRSTLLVAAEHALYGDFVFSVGIGGMFVNGVRLLSKVMR